MYYTRKDCRLCKSENLYQVIQLGTYPHAGDFLLDRKAIKEEKKYPLRIFLCKSCYLLQVLDVINSDIHFKDYRYRSSVVLKPYFSKLAENLPIKTNQFVVEIGSNDGVLLSPLKKRGVKVLGVDPAENIAAIAIKNGIPTIVDYFSEKLVNQIIDEKGRADAIIANNVLAHIDNVDEIFAGIIKLLKPNGVLIFEVHYLLNLIKSRQYDFFYTEHLCYYMFHSLIPFLKKYKLTIVDIQPTPLHGGSIRVFVKKSKVGIKTTGKLTKYLKKEREAGLLNLNTYLDFDNYIHKHKTELRNLIIKLKKSGKRVVGYGASGRANTVLNTANINHRILPYIVDESPERYNRFTPGTHIPIVPPLRFRNDVVDYAVLFAWTYAAEIIKKEKDFINNGGRFILPFPTISIFP